MSDKIDLIALRDNVAYDATYRWRGQHLPVTPEQLEKLQSLGTVCHEGCDCPGKHTGHHWKVVTKEELNRVDVPGINEPKEPEEQLGVSIPTPRRRSPLSIDPKPAGAGKGE